VVIANRAENPGAVIVDGHGHTDLGVVRALGTMGVPVYLVTNNPHGPVRYSRYLAGVFSFPPDAAPELDKIKALRQIGRRFRHRPVLFSTGDTTLMLMSRHRTALEHYYRHHLANEALVEQLNDKRLFAQLAGRHQLPVPMTIVPGNRQELEAALWGLRFPVIVKPAEKRNWARFPAMLEITGGNLKGVRVESARELLRLYDRLSPFNSELVIQEYIEGRDEALYSLYVYIDRKQEVKGWALSQKIRTQPPHCGVATFSVTRTERSIYRLGVSALHALGVTGLAILQVKWSEPHHSYLILEINARHGTSISLYPEAGVNLPYVAYKDSLGQDVTPLGEQEEGVRWADLRGDLRALKKYRAIGEWSWTDFLRSYFGRRTYALFSWSDPVPALVPLWARIRRRSMRLTGVLGGYAKR
jgi:D-aspartate ligase